MSGILAAIAAADEEYLVALANKGLYKRAVRELPEAGVTATAQGDTVTAAFADGTEVVLEGSVKNYRCTCPSRSVCKHLLMAVLAAQELAAGGGPTGQEVQAPPPPDFSALLAVTPKELEKLAGKKLFRGAVLAVQLGEQAVLEEGSTLAVTLLDTGNTVRFLPGGDLSDASCTCKSTNFCSHKAQAVVQYIAAKKGGLPEEFTPPEEEGALEFGAYTLPYIRDFVAEVLSTGLARLPGDTGGRFLQLATICHGQRLANLERLCSRVAGQFEQFARRSSTFSAEYLLSDLCELLTICDAILKEGGSRETVGVFRETYRPVARLELYGLGAWGWRSTGGYIGVTTLFFSPDQGVLTHTTAMPEATSPSVEKLYQTGAPWNLPTKLSAIGHSHLALKGGKLSGKGQLSSSEEGTAQPLGGVDILDEVLALIRFDDFGALLEALWRHMEAGNDGPMAALLIPARAGASRYDKISQRWSLPLYDKAERRLTLTVRYEKSAKLLLENLMELEEKEALGVPMTARISLQDGMLTAFPVTLWGEEPMNLSLDRSRRVKSQKKSYFDWDQI